jgi:flavin reductase
MVTGPRAADGRTADAATFRAVLGRFATGVGIMTTARDGTPHAMTANAVSSVSLDPPLVLVCVERSTVMATEVTGGGAFALSFLDAEQAHLSNRFADPDRPLGRRQFDGVPTRAEATGSPVLEGGIAWLDCRVWNTYDGGDHLIVVGEVVALGMGPSDDPLLYYGSAYGRLAG